MKENLPSIFKERIDNNGVFEVPKTLIFAKTDSRPLEKKPGVPLKDYVISSFHIEKEDFDLNPFNSQGGLGKMWQLFGDKTEEIIGELNEALAA